MQTPLPLTRDLVLVGGGHTHALVLRKWGMQPLPGVRVTVVNPGPTTPYSGMLPGLVAGHYQHEDLQIDLVRLARFAGARLIPEAATGIDRQTREVLLSGGGRLRFDTLSLDVGATSKMPNLPGFTTHGVAAKPLDAFAARWDAFTMLCPPASKPRICVIGAGVAGVELALAMHHRLTTKGAHPQITLIEAGRAISILPGGTRAILFETLRRAEIRLVEFASVAELRKGEVVLQDGRALPSDFTVGAGGARPHGWLSELDLSHTAGFVDVRPTLQTLDDPDIFATGDCAHLRFAPRPKAGVYAVRAAPILWQNLRARLRGDETLRAFRPQRDYLKLISLGGQRAVADKHRLSLQGVWVWRWKDRIDRKFMQKFHELPQMDLPALPDERAADLDKLQGEKPLCGGCGAKVAGSDLRVALAGLPAPTREDVISLPGDDAAILAMESDWQVLSTDHLRAFTLDHVTLARIAAVHALGDIWAMGAAAQAVLASVVLPPMAPALQRATLADITRSASEVFRAEGAEIVGGHSTIGAEMSIGFSLTGLSGPFPMTNAGAQPGDRLILTKPLGTGVLLAAEMQTQAQGADVLHALRGMAAPQGEAARILAPVAHAMTDVTGFGLAGHMMALCEASGVAATLHLADLPIYPGALELIEAGHRATIHAANRDGVARLTVPQTARAEMLFDPQTSGGLLAAVPEELSGMALDAIRAHHPDAAIIGQITDAAPYLNVL